jgi:hypothetical protein
MMSVSGCTWALIIVLLVKVASDVEDAQSLQELGCQKCQRCQGCQRYWDRAAAFTAFVSFVPFVPFVPFVLASIHLATLHDKRYAAHRGDVLQGVAVHGDEVGFEAGPQDADLLLQSHRFRRQ